MKRIRLHWKLLVSSAAVALVLIAGAVAYVLRDQPRSSPKPASNAVRHSTDEPDESKENAKAYQWKGTAEEPKRITIPGIGADSFIQKVGVDQRNEIAVPTNLHLVGWFEDSVRPGQTGLSIIDGHVAGRTQDGVFKNLDELEEGDTFTVTLGNDKVLTYKVIGKVSKPVAESAQEIFSQQPTVRSQLNLVTCSGTYDAKQKGYTERLVVQAELVP